MEWVTTTNISVEAWRRLLEYANTDLAHEAIVRFHGSATKSQNANYKKQAQQIRVAILQAQEYFSAARAATLFTSPNHLYYGMVSLASAIMLLRGTGDKALDKLREEKKHRHHGLEFTTRVSKDTSKKGLTVLEQSHVKVLQNGHFMNWYSTLPLESGIFTKVTEHKHGVSRISRKRVGTDHWLKSCQITKQKRPILKIMSHLPDLHEDLTRYQIDIVSSRVTFEVFDMEQEEIEFTWRIHGTQGPTHLNNIHNRFSYAAEYPLRWDAYEDGRSAFASLNLPKPPKMPSLEFPSMREDIYNNQFIYADNLDTHEIVDAYQVGYALSMLARYYPDYWINCLESHCKAAKLIENFVLKSIDKFPLMALRLLSDDDIVISPLPPAWAR